MTAGAVESAGDAARRFAGELERLRAGLLELGITPQTSGTGAVPAGEWPVSAALQMLRDLLFPVPVFEDCGMAAEAAGSWMEVGPGRSVYRPAGQPRPVPSGQWPVTAEVLSRIMGGPERMFMWLVYEECGSCGAAAKQPCVGQRFGPHEGRETRWARAARERAAGAVGG